MRSIIVNLGSRSYTVSIDQSGLLSKVGKIIRDLNLGDYAFLFTNPTVNSLYGEKVKKSLESADYPVKVLTMPDGEEYKTLKVYEEKIAELTRFDNGVKPFIVNLGGGVVGDVGGFLAATFKRGIPFVQVPTTLLAQVDCGIGGKVGVNTDRGKNIVGAFYQPRGVFADMSVLATLPKREFCSGLAEVIKYGVIYDYQLFTYIENHLQSILSLDQSCLEHIVAKSCEIKASIVEKDELDDKDLRIMLNFGHTIGHALEVATDYSTYRHGEAISFGMVCAGEISVELGSFNRPDLERIENMLKAADLPIEVSDVSIKRIIEAVKHDKKSSSGHNRFVLPSGIGAGVVKSAVPNDLIESVLQKRMGASLAPA